MFAYEVSNMTCGHCADVITKVVLSLDDQAKIGIDLGSHLVSVDSIAATRANVEKAIKAAGYEVVAIDKKGHQAVNTSAQGCCCGSGAARCGT